MSIAPVDTPAQDVPHALIAAREALLDAVAQEPGGAVAAAQSLYVLWELDLICNQPDQARRHLDRAIDLYPLQFSGGKAVSSDVRPSVLSLAAPGDLQANTPLSRLLEPDVAVHTLWIRPDTPDRLADVRTIIDGAEAVWISIAECATHRDALSLADRVARHLGKPVINDGARIARLSRTGSARLLAGIDGLVVPTTCSIAADARPADSLYPCLVRPSDSHAGQGLALVRSHTEFDSLVSDGSLGPPGPRQATRFVDCRGADGLFRKYRIVFVNRRPYPVHLAIHDDWAIWYYNAAMDCHPDRRREEAAFLGDMPQTLGPQAMRALERIAERVGLDYFGLDFGRIADGRLALFEVETGMLVHDHDSPAVYPYKSPAIRRIRDAVSTLVAARSAKSGSAKGRALDDG
ncbi:hypothetical protein AA103196_2372 [Ameyamaea chiangmaiensis NBRC 103196]|uniref:ATP-grasp domain-containing protein n=1 Tax=Ameyamaea chiangmaiensis TaxID=442969 RepID=A0A850PBF5_9PROT|nr:hypothetical protein [Ameyamaea chiangmaiensis]MBS4075371.1 hypothetical protein [Ameyamaea chiangmaiensis]NVN39860.1 hypothetical protein [Ameyamaea chiangmaiensis]GBQ70000.1 hypothetical protein AA103196_2372 [Ameyamaea chiangmaiensis NBRC 103196]